MDLIGLNDARGHKSLTISQLTEDKKEHWNVTLESANFPIAFENSNSSNRQVSMEVVDGTNWNAQDHGDTMLIPLVLAGVTNIDGVITCHYQNKYHYGSNDPLQAKIAATITLEEGKTAPVENPHLQISFSVIKQEMGNQNEQSFGGAPRQAQPFVETVRGQNSNGGLDIPLNQLDRPLGVDDKIVLPA